MKSNNEILIYAHYFLPAKNAGGPPKSLMLRKINSNLRLFVVIMSSKDQLKNFRELRQESGQK